MRKIKVVVLLVRQLQNGFTKNAKVYPDLTVAHILRARLRTNVSSVCRPMTIALTMMSANIKTRKARLSTTVPTR